MHSTNILLSPTIEDVAAAKESAQLLERVDFKSRPVIRMQVSGHDIPLPPSLGQMLSGALRSIAEGRAVAVIRLEEEVTPQDAAELLKVSRPFATRLFDKGAFPSRRVGTHRRALTRDVLAYREQERAARLKTLDELAAEGQKLEL